MLFRRDNFPTIKKVARKGWEPSKVKGDIPIEDVLGRLMCAWHDNGGNIELGENGCVEVSIDECDFPAMNDDIVEANLFLLKQYGWMSQWSLDDDQDGRSIVTCVILRGNPDRIIGNFTWTLSTVEGM